MSREQIEKKWGVTIVDDSYYSPASNKIVKSYGIYSADRCRWDAGFRTLKAVEAECREWSDALLNIKRKVAESRANRGMYSLQV